MTDVAAISHQMRYRYDRAVTMGPQIIRLRPAPHSRTPILRFSMQVQPAAHYLHWQQDPFGNWQARLVFTESLQSFEIDVDLVIELQPFNPFDFFLEPEAAQYPFAYSPRTADALAPYLTVTEPSPAIAAFLATLPSAPMPTVAFLTAVNRAVFDNVRYLLRMEAGVFTPEETLANGEGSCRDSSWLLVHVLRHLGLAARFVSGYLVQLAEDASSGKANNVELHAWAEAYLPGAGWVGVDPTSGLLATESHIPIAATDHPESAAPVEGLVSASQADFSYSMQLRRLSGSGMAAGTFSDKST